MKKLLVVIIFIGTMLSVAIADQFQDVTPPTVATPEWQEVSLPSPEVPSTKPVRRSRIRRILDQEFSLVEEKGRITSAIRSLAPSSDDAPEPRPSRRTSLQRPRSSVESISQPQRIPGVDLPDRPVGMTKREFAQTMVPYHVGQIIHVEVTAYNPTVAQCDADPDENAAGLRPQLGDIAINGPPIGTVVRLHNLPPGPWRGRRDFIVRDRPDARLPYYHVDILWPGKTDQDVKAAKVWGRNQSRMEIVSMP